MNERYEQIANEILDAHYGTNALKQFPGLKKFLKSIHHDLGFVGGKLVSRQVISSAIQTWFLLHKHEVSQSKTGFEE